MTYSDLTICFRSLFQEAPASNSLLNQKTKRATSRTFRGMPFVPNVREIAPNELRVIEKVERLGTDIEAHPFGEIDTLHGTPHRNYWCGQARTCFSRRWHKRPGRQQCNGHWDCWRHRPRSTNRRPRRPGPVRCNP